MSKFNPRNIPHRDHYDRLMTWCMNVFGHLDGEDLAELQEAISQHAKQLANSDSHDDEERIRAVLAEIGFAAVIDSMADAIERANGDQQ